MVFGQLVFPNEGNLQAGKLEKTHLTGSIVHSFATLTFHELFRIKAENVYGIYINPPQGCAIYNVKAKFKDQLTEFVVHELEEPVTNGYFDSNSNSNAINLNLGQISSNTIVLLEITCTFTANLNSLNSFAFDIPMESSLLQTKFSANINVSFPSKNKPKINVSEGSFKIEDKSIVLQPFSPKNKLQITFKYPESIQSAAFSSKIDKFTYMGISIHPTDLVKNSSIKQEIYLLIDCSGSMSGMKIFNARFALVDFLNSLPDNCYFNILRFGSYFEQMFEQSVEKNKENISKALQFASILEADLGGTDIYSPLMSIVSAKPKKGYVRQVFALTDGQVQDEANVIAACSSNRHIMRVFPFGIGDDVNFAFIKDLAKSTMGTAHFIKDPLSISESVISALKSSHVAAVVNAQIHIEGIDSFEVAPNPVPTLFNDLLTHVIVRYENEKDEENESILINGEYDDNTYEESLSVIKIVNLINFEKLFAYHNIRDMEDKLMSINKPDESKKIKENIVRLSMQCAVVSSFTGMFTVVNGVEQKTEKSQQQAIHHQNMAAPTQVHQQQSFMQCQQPITQKQYWNQCAFAQQSQPIQQAPQGWGCGQSLKQQPQMFMAQMQQQPQPQMFMPQMQQQPQTPQQPQQPQMFMPQMQQQTQQMQQPQMFMPQMQQPQMFMPQMQQQPQMLMSQMKQQPQTPQQPQMFMTQMKQQTQQKQQPQMFMTQMQQQPQQPQIQILQEKHLMQPNQMHQFQQPSQTQNQCEVQIVQDLLKRQKQEGCWDEITLLHKIVNTKATCTTINDFLLEFPLLEKDIHNLSKESIITLIIIGWIYSQKNDFQTLYDKQIQKGFAYVILKENMDINEDTIKKFHINDGIAWKY